jgi:hypothetical protein
MNFSRRTWQDDYYDGIEHYDNKTMRYIKNYNDQGWNSLSEASTYKEFMYDCDDDFELKLLNKNK